MKEQPAMILKKEHEFVHLNSSIYFQFYYATEWVLPLLLHYWNRLHKGPQLTPNSNSSWIFGGRDHLKHLLLLNAVFLHIGVPIFIFSPINILPWVTLTPHLLTADDQQIAISNPLLHSDL